MNENFDLTKILKGCPKGTKFYSPIFGEVELDHIYGCQIGISCVILNRLYTFNAAGKYEMVEMGCSNSWGNYYYSDECLLFPSKEQRDWSKFVRFWDNSKVEVEKFDVNTLQPFDKVLVRDADYFVWNACWFSHAGVDEYTGTAMCDGAFWNQCIPYNEETKHLIGTNKDCPEYYKWWEE